MAAPIASQILGEVLPYLQINKNEGEDNELTKVKVPDIVGLKINEAQKILKEYNLNLETNENTNENMVVTEQIPIPGIEVFEQSNIIVK